MARGTPFYLREPFIKSVKKRPSLVKREINRVFNNAPEGDQLPYQITRWTLALIAGGTLVTALAVAPGLAFTMKALVDAIKESDNPHAKRIAKYKDLKRTIERLHRQGFIKIEKHHRRQSVALTDKGLMYFMSHTIEDLAIPEPKKWDKVWRVIAFDIPETRKNARDALRHKLQGLGFLQLQKSLFAYPYPCRDEIDYLLEVFNIWEHVTFLETASLGRQEPEARQYFDFV